MHLTKVLENLIDFLLNPTQFSLDPKHEPARRTKITYAERWYGLSAGSTCWSLENKIMLIGNRKKRRDYMYIYYWCMMSKEILDNILATYDARSQGRCTTAQWYSRAEKAAVLYTVRWQTPRRLEETNSRRFPLHFRAKIHNYSRRFTRPWLRHS